MFFVLPTGLIRPQKGSVTNRKHKVLLSEKKQNKAQKLLEVALVETLDPTSNLPRAF